MGRPEQSAQASSLAPVGAVRCVLSCRLGTVPYLGRKGCALVPSVLCMPVSCLQLYPVVHTDVPRPRCRSHCCQLPVATCRRLVWVQQSIVVIKIRCCDKVNTVSDKGCWESTSVHKVWLSNHVPYIR